MGLCRKAIYSIISTYTVSQKVTGLLVKQVTQNRDGIKLVVKD